MLPGREKKNIAVPYIEYLFIEINGRLGLIEKNQFVPQKLRAVFDKIIGVNIGVYIMNPLQGVYIEIVGIENYCNHPRLK